MGLWHGAFISFSKGKGGRYIYLQLPLWRMPVSYTLLYVYSHLAYFPLLVST